VIEKAEKEAKAEAKASKKQKVLPRAMLSHPTADETFLRNEPKTDRAFVSEHCVENGSVVAVVAETMANRVKMTQIEFNGVIGWVRTVYLTECP
jgi:hypothetical protein